MIPDADLIMTSYSLDCVTFPEGDAALIAFDDIVIAAAAGDCLEFFIRERRGTVHFGIKFRGLLFGQVHAGLGR